MEDRMFLEDVFLENAKNDLAGLVSRGVANATDRPYRWDPYVAKSQLQKGIRRGDAQNALSAARFLLQVNDQGFWRRLCLIVLEDIGIANVPLVAQVLLSEKDRALRNHLGGPQKVGLSLVSAMCASAKDRSTDDLIDAIASPDFDCLKAKIAEQSEDTLFGSVSSPAIVIHHRVMVASRLATTSTATARAKKWCWLLEQLPEDVLSPCVKVTANLWLQLTKSEMALLLALLSRDAPFRQKLADDELPASSYLHGLPSWALDGHTRIGLQAFRFYIKRSGRISAFIKKWSTGSVSPSKVVAGLVFRTESAQLVRRLVWETGDQLKAEACNNRPGLPSDASAEGLALVRDEFDLVNECRADAVGVYLR
jgi:hypothetical protein